VNRHTIKYCPDEAFTYRSNKQYGDNRSYKNKNNKPYNKYDRGGRGKDVPEWYTGKDNKEIEKLGNSLTLYQLIHF
jgi:hypothetical protein